MRTGLWLLVVGCAAGCTTADAQSTFGLWKSAELQQRGQALSTHVAADHSSRETLADYGDHRFRLLYRDADGDPEQHDRIVDVVIVQSGEGTLVMGGTMIGRRSGSGAGEFVGTSLDGGERHALGAGDVVHIPAAIPHRFLVANGKHLTYVLVKFPAISNTRSPKVNDGHGSPAS